MSSLLPPNPSQYRDLNSWARQFYEFMVNMTNVQQKADPLPLLLLHRTHNAMLRAAQDGVMIYDPKTKTPLMAVDGVWEPLRSAPLLEAHYQTAYNVNGAALGTGGQKIPFNTSIIDIAPWADFNPTTGDFDLDQGTYFIDGYVTLDTTGASGTKTFTGYLAESSDLTTPVGDVTMGTLVLPSSVKDANFVLPFRGQVSIPSTGTYAMVVNTSGSDVGFGIAHNINGYDNDYAAISIAQIGLNE